jgi:hypothetical protein
MQATVRTHPAPPCHRYLDQELAGATKQDPDRQG